jgi:hypothetical protein
MNDQLDDLTMDVSRVNRRSGVHLNAQMVHDHRVDLTIDPECYVRRDRNLDVTMVVKNLHVKLLVYLSKSCDRMSHDHLQFVHLMMRHRDKNLNLDGTNLDGKMKIHHVNHRMTGDRLKVCPMRI